MFLFMDTETNGLPKNYKAPASDFNNWPEVLQIAFELYDAKGYLRESRQLLIDHKLERLDAGAQSVHGITLDDIRHKGIELEKAVRYFYRIKAHADFIVCHNYDFDSRVWSSNIQRSSYEPTEAERTPCLQSICTMKSTTNVCKIKGKYGLKWPKLEELHEFLFGEKFDGAHEALADVKATARCFFELKKRNLI